MLCFNFSNFVDKLPSIRVLPTFNFIPPKADTDPMLVGFDYSKEINWSPGQPAPEGYRVVNMMGDEFLERKFPSKEEVAGLPRVFSEGGRVRFSEGANIKIQALTKKGV